MPSVPSLDRQKASTVFRSVEHSHVQDVLPVIENQLREVLIGEETLPDVAFVATLFGRLQTRGTRRLLAAENAYDGEVANDAGPRLLRDEAGERVYRKLVEVRRIADGLFGPEHSAKVLGTAGATAPVAEGERLWRQAEDTANRLEAPEFTVPVMTTSSLQFDPARLVAELRSDNDAFREALDAVALEQRKAEASLEVKRERLAASERIDAACRRFYEGFFLMADREDLLDRLRRALRRRARPGSRPDDVAPPEPDPPQDEPSPDGEPPPDGEAFASIPSDD